jgi:excisionase family DNA binding protein
MTRRQAAEALGVSIDTIANLIDAGELRAIRIGKSVRLTHQELGALIDRGNARTRVA